MGDRSILAFPYAAAGLAAPIRPRSLDALREARAASGMSSGRFAREINRALGYGSLNAGHIDAWEREVCPPPADVFVAALQLVPAADRARILEDMFA